MRSRTLLSFLSVVAVASFATYALPVGAQEKDDPKKDGTDAKDGHDAKPDESSEARTTPVACVTMAKTWADAIKDAKAQNVPIVLHNHGFYCPPCWGMHETVMGDKAYIEFAYENAIEVLSLDRLQDGVLKKDARAATYDAKVGGKPVKFLIQFPGLTVDDVLAVRNSKASSYNKSGGLPYTALIDPFTEGEIKSWKGGGIAATDIMAAVTDARKTLAKAHGKGKPRPELKAVADAETAVTAKLTAGDFAGALDACAAATKKSEKDGWPPHLRDRLTKAHDDAIAKATEALDAIEKAKADDAVKAKKDLAMMMSRLRGTGLEQRAKDLLAGM